MKTPEQSTIVVIAGATATGKSAIATQLAESLNCELIGADSIQVYRRLDIGAAKPTISELRGVPHHLLDVAAIDEAFDAARYVHLADQAIQGVMLRGRRPLVVGGTGLYLRALIRGLARGIPSDGEVRAALNARAALGSDELARMHAELTKLDPVYAARIHPADPIRIVRAMEVHQISGEPLSAHHARHAAEPPRYRALFIALETDRATLRARIKARTDGMLAHGWIDEVKEILNDGYAPTLKPLQSVGYAEVTEHVIHGVPIEETRSRIVSSTAAFAKRQRTWFRGEKSAIWVPIDELATPQWNARLKQHWDVG